MARAPTAARPAPAPGRVRMPAVVARRNANALAPLVEEIQDAGGRALPIAADASDESAIVALFDRAEQEFGPPEVVVFNAAGFSMASILDTSREQFEDLWRATAFGGFMDGVEIPQREARPLDLDAGRPRHQHRVVLDDTLPDGFVEHVLHGGAQLPGRGRLVLEAIQQFSDMLGCDSG